MFENSILLLQYNTVYFTNLHKKSFFMPVMIKIKTAIRIFCF